MREKLSELMRRLPPSSAPVNANADWSAVEATLEFRLPQDYKDYISIYGSGQLSCGLQVYNYSVETDRDRIAKDLDALATILDHDLELRSRIAKSLRQPQIQPAVPFPCSLNPMDCCCGAIAAKAGVSSGSQRANRIPGTFTSLRIGTRATTTSPILLWRLS